jgi:hypothetical protein
MADRGALAMGLFLATDFAPAVDLPSGWGPEVEWLLAFNARATRLAVSYRYGKHLLVFNPRSGREVARLADFKYLQGLAFLSTEVLLVTYSGGCTRCDLRRGGRAALWEGDVQPSTLAVSPNGRDVAIGLYPGLVVLDTVKQEVRCRMRAGLARGSDGYGPRYAPAFSAGGRYVAADLHQDQRGHHLVVVWDAHTGRRQRIFDADATALAFRDDTLALAVADDSCGEIQLYEPDQGEEPVARFRGYSLARALQFRDGGRSLGVLGYDGSLSLLSAENGAVLQRAAPSAGRELTWAVPSADWSLFAAATQGGVVIWPGGRAEPPAAADGGRDSGSPEGSGPRRGRRC